ncbi:hypothetical protein LBMAG42_36230 [Deltaproteobacteria bacterium]|nr:hypothetical protein LBMAG42_36230 [Deltaproteobacteria bacterium]
MLLLALLGCSTSSEWASARKIDSLADTIGGPKATARPGDFLLENDRVRIAVLGPRYSMGPSPFGGTLCDADLQRADPSYGAGHGNDQLAEVFATVNMNIAGADTEGEVLVLQEGSETEAAIVRATGEGTPFLTMLKPLWAIVGQPDFQITTDYILEPGSPAVKMITTASEAATFTEATTLAGSTDELALLEYAMVSGLSFGDFYLQGGSIDVFAPGTVDQPGGFDEDQLVSDAVNDGKNTFQSPFKFEFLAGVGDGVSYALMADSGDLFVPLFTSSQTAGFGAGQLGEVTDEGGAESGDETYNRFPGGKAYQYVRWFGVGKGDVGSALDSLIEARGMAHGTVRGFVVEEGTGIAVSKTNVMVFAAGAEQAWSQWQTDVGDDTQLDGNFGGMLPPGDYELLVHHEGSPDGERVAITVVEGKEVKLVLGAKRSGQLDLEVVDETGRNVPAKVTIVPVEGDSPLSRELGDKIVAGGAAEVLFLTHGTGSATLPPGTYTAIASRGLEYELGTSEPFTVRADGAAHLKLQVLHTVETDGWVSADFHVHASHSFDSGVSLESRVITMVAEGVDFFSSSDHDYLTDYAPVVEQLGLEPFVKTAVGLETTTLEVGHYIGMPLAHDTIKDQAGAFDWTGMTPLEILDELQSLGVAGGYEPLRMVAHPRDGILGYFDQYGYNAYSGQVETPTLSFANDLLKDTSYFTTDFDALELLNGKRFDLIRTPTQPELDAYAAGGHVSAYTVMERSGEEQLDLADDVYRLGYGHDGQVDDWFSLLNTGVRLTALGNSDTHSRFSIEAGCPRNYVYVDHDDPATLDEQAVADAVKAGHVVASYGPFIRFTANADAMIGDTLTDTDGNVSLHIEVQAPTWMAVDRVELYQNGALIHEWEGLDPDVLKFAQDLDVAVTKDSWFVVIALGDGDLSPVFTPVEIPPVELQDVVIEALSTVPAISAFVSPGVPVPRDGPVLPYALTNPIWVDVDGDGEITPPGIPEFMREPVEPE